jgi:hypothetical protein
MRRIDGNEFLGAIPLLGKHMSTTLFANFSNGFGLPLILHSGTMESPTSVPQQFRFSTLCINNTRLPSNHKYFRAK